MVMTDVVPQNAKDNYNNLQRLVQTDYINILQSLLFINVRVDKVRKKN